MVPEIDLTGMQVLRDPFTAYGRAREQAPLARVGAPGFGPMWAVTRYDDAKRLLVDPRFEINTDSFMRPDVPAEYLPLLRTMSEMAPSEHLRQRRLVAPAFTPRRAAEFRPRIEPIVEKLLDGLDGGDLLAGFARPLPMDVICELVGIDEADRPQWREYGAAVAMGAGQKFAEAVPGILDGAKEAVARKRAEPGDDVISDLIRAQDENGDRLSDAELVTLVWHLVLAGQTPTNLIANAIEVLLTSPGDRAAFHENPAGAVDELIRLHGPGLLTIPRYASEDVELPGATIAKGEPVLTVIAAANRDPRAFTDPDRLVASRTTGHLGFAHGPHFCLGASLARVETEVALTVLLRRFPELAIKEAERAPDPGTWRLSSLVVSR
ncbi:cytochrome P450 [Amycolatopsis sp. NPDC059657]|uniref:cytochrome P450 n=1 Tax=Amycolatopsis sp. NPDC059657 TaxID=3346899 RepID=UPI003672F09D